MNGVLWLILFAIFLIIEIVTVGLTAIWMAVGSLAGFAAQKAGLGILGQFSVFFLVSVILIFFTKPVVKKYFNTKHLKTNYESVIGKEVKVTETIDNLNEKGTAVVGGQEWTARAQKNNEIIEKGSIVKVIEISGVKLIVKKI